MNLYQEQRKELFGLFTIVLFAILVLSFSCTKKVLEKPIVVDTFSSAVPEPKPAPAPIQKVIPQVKPVIAETAVNKSIGTALFEFDSDRLTLSGKHILDVAMDFVCDQEGCHILLTGGACPIGDYDYNMKLGIRRVISAARYISRVEPGIITRVESVGEDNLITDIESDYYLNRRVEIEVRND